MKNHPVLHPLASAITFLLAAGSGALLTLPNSAFAAPVTVDSVGILNPNPSNLVTIEVGNISLASARVSIADAFTLGIGGVIDFQQKFQGGTFPNAPSSNNGVDVATDSANPLQVTTSSSGSPGNLVATGPVIFSFFRSDAITAGSIVTNDNIDSNTNQGTNTISGGYKSRNPGAVSASNPNGDGTSVLGSVDFSTVPPTPDAGAAGIGGSYMGITNAGSPATFVFDSTPLSFFGITALPRGATRDTLITLTQTPIGGGAPIQVQIGSATVVGTSAVFFGQTAEPGYQITQAAFTNPNGQGVNRYDDFAYILAVPEPTSMTLGILGGLGMLGLMRRRRA